LQRRKQTRRPANDGPVDEALLRTVLAEVRPPTRKTVTPRKAMGVRVRAVMRMMHLLSLQPAMMICQSVSADTRGVSAFSEGRDDVGIE